MSRLDDVVSPAPPIEPLLGQWRITITFAAEGITTTRAMVELHAGLDRLRTEGAARKHPADPFDLDLGHLVAAARGLDALAARLRELAALRTADPADLGEVLVGVERAR